MVDTRPKLLIVEDDPGLQRQLRWAYDGYQLFIAGDREEAIDILRAEAPDVVTLDLGLPPDPDGTSEGFAALEEILRIKPDTKIVAASGHGARESALKAISLGAYDFYQKPVDIDELGLIVSRAFHVHRLERENARLVEQSPEDNRVLGRLITAAPEMLRVAHMVERVAGADVSVMLEGASGTGKQLLAQGLHDASHRRSGPFVAINCAAIPEALLDAELFGPGRTPLGGVVSGLQGKIEQAEGGTLFLDEVSGLAMPLQAKLLRFLQERTIERPGGRDATPVDVRIVCATQRSGAEMIPDGTFREDLFYRLAEIVIRVPTLAERAGDPALLARHFLTRFAQEMNPAIKGIAPDALAALDGWGWPGNVRELENRMKRAVIMAEGKMVTAADLDLDVAGQEGGGAINLKAAREMADRKAIRHAIARTQGNISGAARMLGISRPTLYDLIRQYEIKD